MAGCVVFREAALARRVSFAVRTRTKLLRKLGLLVVGVSLVALGASPAFALDRPQVFSLLDVSEREHPIGGFQFNREPRGGDAFAFTDGLYRWAGKKRGARVGRVEVLCTFTTFEGGVGTALCAGSFFLPAGQVLASGFLRFAEGPGRFTVPVVGGTGAYANARGYLKIRDIGPEDSGNSNVEFHLLP